MFTRQLRCSFCRRKESEVSKLVAGSRVYICDSCVALASRIMENASSDDTPPPQAQASVWRKLLARARQVLWGGDVKRVGFAAGFAQPAKTAGRWKPPPVRASALLRRVENMIKGDPQTSRVAEE